MNNEKLKITKNKKQSSYIFLQIYNKDGELIEKVASHKTKRIFRFIQAKKIKDCIFNVCVRYDKNFLNEGEYLSKKDLCFALRSFLEK